MVPVIGDILPIAIGIALSPLSVSAAILMLFTKKARANSLAFLVGWFLGLALVGFVVLALVNTGRITLGDETESLISGVIKLLVGLLLLLLGAPNQWRSRQKDGEEPEMPKWMDAIDNFTSGKAAGLAFLLSGINPKNLALNLAAAITIADSGLAMGEQALTLVIFATIASLAIVTPILYYLIAGASAEKTLETWKSWLNTNNATVMTVLFVILGFKLLGDGLAILLG